MGRVGRDRRILGETMFLDARSALVFKHSHTRGAEIRREREQYRKTERETLSVRVWVRNKGADKDIVFVDYGCACAYYL